MFDPESDGAEVKKQGMLALFDCAVGTPEDLAERVLQVAEKWGDQGVASFLFALGRTFAMIQEQQARADGAEAEEGALYQMVIVNAQTMKVEEPDETELPRSALKAARFFTAAVNDDPDMAMDLFRTLTEPEDQIACIALVHSAVHEVLMQEMTEKLDSLLEFVEKGDGEQA